MRIRFEMSGGYGGLFAAKPLALDVNTENLPDEARDKLIDIVEASGVRHITPEEVPPPASSIRDAIQYRLSITEAGETRSFAFDDSNVLASLRPLLNVLRQQAIERRATPD